MKPDLSPYIAFEGNARDALTFYAEVFGGNPLFEYYHQYNASDDPADQDRVLYGVLRSPDGFIIRVTDVPSKENLTFGNNHYICINGDDDVLLRECWERLSRQATINKQLEVSEWGDAYGELIDQFGVIWQVNIGDSE